MESPTFSETHPLLAESVHVVIAASWLYTFKGMYYYGSHRFLWPLLRGRVLPCVILSIIVFVNLFLWTYLPQVAFLAMFYGTALAWVHGFFLVLGEGATIIAILFETFLVDETLVDIFDAVLIHEGLEDLVQEGRAINTQETDPVKRLGKPKFSRVYSPFSFRQMFEFIILLPISFIPIVGLPIFLVSTGYRAGPLQHWRYFKLLKLTRKEREKKMKDRWWRYTKFGTVHLALQLIPGLSMLFLLTTAAGSGMWAAKLEKKRRLEVLSRSRAPVHSASTASSV